MRKKLAIGIILIMLFSLFPQLMVFSLRSDAVLAAGSSLATLEDINGGVFVKKGGGAKEFKGIKGMALTQGDSVRTDKEGSATVVFYTGSKMAVGPSTSFTVNKLKETKDNGGKLSVKLKSGTVWNKVKSLVNVEDEYEIETPTAVMGVRGTLFMVSVDPATGGQSTTSVFEGSIRADYAAASGGPSSSNHASQLLQMGQSGTVLPPQRTPGSSIYNPQFPAAPPPPPPPQPIDTQSLVQNQAPSILANMAMDIVDRMQEMQRQNEALMASYQNTNNPAYLQSALQQSQVNSLLGSLNQQYMSAVQGSPQEQQMNQFLQQQNRNMDTLRQQAQELQEQAQQMRRNTENAAQQAGLSPDQIQRLLQNAVTASAAAGAGTSRIAPPPVAPPAQPNQPTPSTPPTSGGGGNGDGPGPIQLEDIVISSKNDKIEVGAELTARVIPSNEETAYLWMVFNKYIGDFIAIPGATSNKYKLKPEDGNKLIKVVATGSGKYTGTVASNEVYVDGGPQAASPGVVLHGQDPYYFQAGDILEFRFDKPVKLCDLTKEAWEAAGIGSLGGEGLAIRANDVDKDGYDDAIEITLGEGFALNHDSFFIEAEAKNGIKSAVQFTMPSFIEPIGYYDENGTVTNLSDPDTSPSEMGSYGSYGVIPDKFMIRGTLKQRSLDNSVLLDNSKVRLGIWFYDDDYNRIYVKPKGGYSNNPSRENMIMVNVISLRKGDYENNIADVYTWGAELPIGMRNTLNNGPTRDYFIELSVASSEEVYDEAEYDSQIVVGSFTMERNPPEITGQDISRDTESLYTLKLFFNKPLSNLDENYANTLSIAPFNKIEINSVCIDKEYDQSGRTLYIEFIDPDGDLEKGGFHSGINVTSSIPIEDIWGNKAALNLTLYKHSYWNDFKWLPHSNPLLSINLDNTSDTTLTIDASENITDSNNLDKYFRTIGLDGEEVQDKITSTSYSDRQLVINFNLNENNSPIMVELVPNSTAVELKCEHEVPFKSTSQLHFENGGRQIIGVYDNGKWYDVRSYFGLTFEFEDENIIENDNLTLSIDSWKGLNKEDKAELNKYFILKNISEYYLPTTARIISAEFKKGDGGTDFIELSIGEEKNLKPGTVIMPLTTLKNVWGFDYSSSHNNPFLPLRYDGDGKWIKLQTS